MYYDDFTVGQKFFLEPVTISEAEILEFAKKYDPLPIHIYPEFAKILYSGIIASGFHTLCAIHAKMIKLRIVYEEVIGGLGIDYLQWSNPVHPNDTLRGEVRLRRKSPLPKEGRGFWRYRVVVRNQDDQLVMTYQVKSLVKSRN